MTSRIDSKDNLLNKLNVSVIENLNGDVDKQDKCSLGKRLQKEDKILIGTLAHFEPAQSVADSFGLSREYVKNLKNGSIPHKSNEENEALADAVKETVKAKRETIQNSALDKIILLVDGINPDQVVKHRDKASIAKDLSITTKNIFGEERNPFSAKVTIYSPGESKESRYDEIEISTR